ncbi:ABC transporter permease [Actinokineospora diospyrosa]|nr:ABC transporter permease [Actinokineospora diospyrosa]
MPRELLAHKGRLAMTLLAIALGVAATVASWVAADSVATSLAGTKTRGDVGVAVRAADASTTMSSSTAKRLRGLPGVQRVHEVVVGKAGLIGRDGKLVAATTVLDRAGTNWDDSGRFTLTDGRAPRGPGEIAIGRTEAGKSGLGVGDRTTVLLSDGRARDAVVSGLFDYVSLGPRSGDGADPVPAVAYDRESARALLGERLSRVELVVQSGVDPDAVVRAALGVGYVVSTGSELAAAAAAESDDTARELRETLLPLAAIALLVGMVVIANTFTMLVTQRTRQFALLRAIGAKRRQIRVAVVAEALVLGLVGGTIGTLIGIGLGPVLLAVMRPGDDLGYTVSPVAVLLGYAVAVVVTVVAASGAARRAALVPPMAALRADAVVPKDVLVRRSALGSGLVVAAVVAVVATAGPSEDNLTRIIGLLSALVGAAGVLLLAPALAVLLFRPLLGLARRHGGSAVRLGVRNAARDPRRTAGTATAITVGLGLICAFGLLSATFATLIASTTRANVPAGTTVLQPAAGGASVLSPSELDKVRATPGVSRAAASRDKIVPISYPGGRTERKISAIEPDALGTVLTPTLTAGVADLRRGVVISQNQADMLGLGLGAPITLVPDPRTPINTTIVGIYEATELGASIFYDVALAPAPLRDQLTIIYASGPTARTALGEGFAQRPDVTVTDREGLVAQGIEAQRLAFALLYAMFGVAIVIAVFGVVNTLALSVMERTREIGVLRAIGASRALVKRTIRVESIVISLFGALLGVTLGLAVGAVMQHAMFGQHLWDITVPIGVILTSLTGIVVAAVVAALWPAAKAAKTDVLAAIG